MALTKVSNSMIVNASVNPVDFGADPTGVADSAAAFTAAVAYSLANNLALEAQGTFKFLSTVNLRYICLALQNATFNIAHAGIGIFIGGNASSANNPPQQIGSVSRSVGTDAYNTPTIRCIGAKGQHITVQYAPYFQIYANTDPLVDPTDYSTAYSTFVLKYCDTVELTNNAASTGSPVQWINENFFYLNRTLNLLMSGTYDHNHNYFEGGCFEGGATINIQSGWTNYIRDIRQEGTLAVTFAARTQDNIVTIGWTSSSHRYPPVGLTVVNNGAMNAVQHNFDIYAPKTPLVGFGYQTLKKVGSDYNVIGVQNLSINPTDLAVTSFVTMYVSPSIPIDGENTIFDLSLFGASAGGFRVKVDGYNASNVLITPAAGQVEYDGAAVQPFGTFDSGSNTERSRAFFILDPNCKFVVITVISGGAGAAFEGFLLTARIADIALRQRMMSYIYATNNFV
jgi:hypothetical protein